jgi:phospholipid transport system substrate-binding protein
MRALTAITGAACLALAAAWAFPAWSQDKSAGGAAANTQDPSQLVQSVAEGLLKDLDANRDLYRKDPKAMRALVDKHLLPYFDVQYSARLVLGKHNRDITPEQRERFINAFESSLVQNYGSALAEFTANRLKVFPSHVDPSAKSTTVRSEIRRDDGSTVPVDYTLHMTDGGWKAWDVVISGISYVKSFRDDFGAQIDQQGIDAVIDRMEKGGKPAGLQNQTHPTQKS